MNILLIFPGFICAFVLILLYEMELRKLRKLSARLKNKTRFYVARDKDETLWLYMGKPRRGIDRFYSCKKGCPMKIAGDFTHYSPAFFITFGLLATYSAFLIVLTHFYLVLTQLNSFKARRKAVGKRSKPCRFNVSRFSRSPLILCSL